MDLSRPRRTASALVGRAVDALPSGAGRRVRAALGRPGPRHLTIDELDAELRRATALMATAPDEAHALLQSFALALPSSPPANPFSAPYREWTWALYRRISGRDSYDTSHEASPFDLELARERPFPYQSGSLAMVGRDLAARGHLLRCLAELAPRRVCRVRSGLGQRHRRHGGDRARRHRGRGGRELLPPGRRARSRSGTTQRGAGRHADLRGG